MPLKFTARRDEVCLDNIPFAKTTLPSYAEAIVRKANSLIDMNYESMERYRDKAWAAQTRIDELEEELRKGRIEIDALDDHNKQVITALRASFSDAQMVDAKTHLELQKVNEKLDEIEERLYVKESNRRYTEVLVLTLMDYVFTVASKELDDLTYHNLLDKLESVRQHISEDKIAIDARGVAKGYNPEDHQRDAEAILNDPWITTS